MFGTRIFGGYTHINHSPAPRATFSPSSCLSSARFPVTSQREGRFKCPFPPQHPLCSQNFSLSASHQLWLYLGFFSFYICRRVHIIQDANNKTVCIPTIFSACSDRIGHTVHHLSPEHLSLHNSLIHSITSNFLLPLPPGLKLPFYFLFLYAQLF